MTLTRDEILKKRAELARQPVEVAELGGPVLIRAMTLKEVSAAQKAARATTEPLALYPRLIAVACINDDGSPLFVGEDVRLIDDLPFAALDTLARAIITMNRMDEASQAPKPSTPMNGSSID